MDDKIYIKNFDDASLNICEKIQRLLAFVPDEIKANAQEIRLRANRNVIIVCPEKSYFLLPSGNISENNSSLIMTSLDIQETFKKLCNYSVYSYQNQIKNGFITLKGGHRAGICGTAVVTDGKITNLRDISSINIRIAKEIKGCSNAVLETIESGESGVLIAGPPASGKTTILRDIARNLSLKHQKVAIVDERSEIGAIHQGQPSFDIGLCDVLDGYPKGDGILQAIRVLSPNVIICDEVGMESDVVAIEQSLNAGVKIIASIHARNLEELLKRPQAKSLLNSGAFEKIIFLDNQNNPGKIFKIYETGEADVKNNRDDNVSYIRRVRRLSGSV